MSNEVAKKESTQLANLPADLQGMVTQERPKGHDEGILGSEGMGRQDIAMPRIGLAQKMSPEIDPTSPRVIKDLKFTDLFHSKTKQVIAQPLYFLILRREKTRWVEFRPMDQGGGIVDPDVPFGDERTYFGSDGSKPVATEFRDYLILMLQNLDWTNPLQNLVALSLKSSALKAAKDLNFLIQSRGPKLICKGVYALTTGHETDKKTNGVYATYKFDNAGWLAEGSAIEKLAIEMFDAWKDRTLDIEREQDPPDHVPASGDPGDAPPF